MPKLAQAPDDLSKDLNFRSRTLTRADPNFDASTSFGVPSDFLLQLITRGQHPGRRIGSASPHLGEALPRVVGGAGYPTNHA